MGVSYVHKLCFIVKSYLQQTHSKLDALDGSYVHHIGFIIKSYIHPFRVMIKSYVHQIYIICVQIFHICRVVLSFAG